MNSRHPSIHRFLTLVAVILAAPLTALAAPTATESDTVYDLPRCITTALEENFDIRKAREQIEKQYGVKMQARARFLPKLDMQGSFDRIDNARVPAFQGQRFGANKDWSAQALVTQSIYSGGADAAQLRRTSALEEAARRELETVINDVLFQVKSRFYAVLLARAQLRVEEENLKLLEEELRIEQNKLSAGTVSDFNVLRAEVALANSRTPHIRARNQVKLTVEELSRVLGLRSAAVNSGNTPIEVKGDLGFEPLLPDLSEALAAAERDRPELKRIQLAIEASDAAVRAAYAEYLPSISLQGGYTVSKLPFTDDLSDELHGWVVGARASWNLFDGLATSGRVTEAKSAKRTERFNLGQAQVEIGVEVRRAHSSLIESQELVQASRKVESQAVESLRLATARFQAGASPQIDVLDSQVALTQARTNEVQALHDYNIARAAFERAVGANLALKQQGES